MFAFFHRFGIKVIISASIVFGSLSTHAQEEESTLKTGGAVIDLFPDSSFRYWERLDGGDISEIWEVTDDGWIHLAKPMGSRGSLLSVEDFGDFEFSFEWKIKAGVNSGVKYRVQPFGARMLGLEYQILDEVSKPSTPLHQSGSIYDLFPASESKPTQEVGQVNHSKIVVRQNHIEHWLNGSLVSQADVGSDSWHQAIGKSKHAERNRFGENLAGRLMITDHKGEIWIRNARLVPYDDGIVLNRHLWNKEKLNRPPNFRWLDERSPIRSLMFESEPYQGKVTETFGFYASPETLSQSQAGSQTKSNQRNSNRRFPAVVLLHGGGGTAFAEWVNLWAQRGYAALAIDLGGDQPSAPSFDPDTGALQAVTNKREIRRTRLGNGGPADDHTAKFDNVGGDRTDDWQYHAVANAMRAHSLLRSFAEVDSKRTAVTGISWGGYLTCLVASVDERFEAAIPVYGCGFLYDGESVQRPLIDRLADVQRAEWIRLYDPSSWLSDCQTPIMFVNGTKDIHYPLPSYARSYQLVGGPLQLQIDPGMGHSHQRGWSPKEIFYFVDQHLQGKDPLPHLDSIELRDSRVSSKWTATIPIGRADLHYTLDDGQYSKRTWHALPAEIQRTTVSADLPEGATAWLLMVTDLRGARVSSGVAFREP